MASRKKDRVPRRLFKKQKEGQWPTVPPGTKVVYQPAGREKMSSVLEDFVDPYFELTDSEDAYNKLLSLGMLAWNAALLPKNKRRAMIDDVLGKSLAKATAADLAQARTLVEELVLRKLEHFPDNHRAIVSFKLTDTGDGYHLSVASTL